jgi:hypothetical protein
MNYRELEEDGVNQTVYFILNESRNLPPAERVALLLSAKHIASEKAVGDEIYELSMELEDCEQAAQRLIGWLREHNQAALVDNIALQFYLAHLEKRSLEEKLSLIGNHHNAGFQSPDVVKQDLGFHEQYMEALERTNRLNGQFELLLFRLRTRRWSCSNQEVITADKVAMAKAAKVARQREASASAA